MFVQFSMISPVFTLYKARARQLKVTERGDKWGVITASARTAVTNKNTHMDTNITQRETTQTALRHKQTRSREHTDTHNSNSNQETFTNWLLGLNIASVHNYFSLSLGPVHTAGPLLML